VNGLSCLFGDSHIDRVSGKVIINYTGKELRDDINKLSNDTRNLLRKKKYDFKTSSSSSSSSSSSAQQGALEGKGMDLSAYPIKEVKLVDFSNKVYIAPLTTGH
jgi:hypothetical protein